jgi:hypothetical protein
MNLKELIISRGHYARQVSFDVVLQDINSLGYRFTIEEVRQVFREIKYPSLQLQIDNARLFYGNIPL